MVVKKRKYTPIDDTISVEVALVQAATALDLAAAMAERVEDAATLVAIAQVWVKMGASLISAESEEDNEKDLTSKSPLGFEADSLAILRKEKEKIDDSTEDRLLPHLFWMKPECDKEIDYRKGKE